MQNTKLILLMSGKRKCGKDYLAEKLLNNIGEEECAILRISKPIKSHYAKEHNLDLTQLMSENSYKEKYRLEMIEWSDSVRLKDPGYFCSITCSNAPHKPIWIISDIRRKTDIRWFKETYGTKIKTLRMTADVSTRKERGWKFTNGVDDVTSECDLDDYKDWDLKISNNNQEELDDGIERILGLIRHFL